MMTCSKTLLFLVLALCAHGCTPSTRPIHPRAPRDDTERAAPDSSARADTRRATPENAPEQELFFKWIESSDLLRPKKTRGGFFSNKVPLLSASSDGHSSNHWGRLDVETLIEADWTKPRWVGYGALVGRGSGVALRAQGPSYGRSHGGADFLANRVWRLPDGEAKRLEGVPFGTLLPSNGKQVFQLHEREVKHWEIETGQFSQLSIAPSAKSIFLITYGWASGDHLLLTGLGAYHGSDKVHGFLLLANVREHTIQEFIDASRGSYGTCGTVLGSGVASLVVKDEFGILQLAEKALDLDREGAHSDWKFQPLPMEKAWCLDKKGESLLISGLHGDKSGLWLRESRDGKLRFLFDLPGLSATNVALAEDWVIAALPLAGTSADGMESKEAGVVYVCARKSPHKCKVLASGVPYDLFGHELIVIGKTLYIGAGGSRWLLKGAGGHPSVWSYALDGD